MISACTAEEALRVLRHSTVAPLLSVYPEAMKDVEMYHVGGALLVVMPLGEMAEVHLACAMRDRAGLRDDLREAMAWLREREFSAIFTDIPEHRVALKNMLVKLGFTPEANKWVYRWE